MEAYDTRSGDLDPGTYAQEADGSFIANATEQSTNPTFSFSKLDPTLANAQVAAITTTAASATSTASTTPSIPNTSTAASAPRRLDHIFRIDHPS